MGRFESLVLSFISKSTYSSLFNKLPHPASGVATWYLGTTDTGGQLVAESEPFTKVTNGALLSTDLYIYVDTSQIAQ
jgi:hypothetical protein